MAEGRPEATCRRPPVRRPLRTLSSSELDRLVGTVLGHSQGLDARRVRAVLERMHNG